MKLFSPCPFFCFNLLLNFLSPVPSSSEAERKGRNIFVSPQCMRNVFWRELHNKLINKWKKINRLFIHWPIDKDTKEHRRIFYKVRRFCFGVLLVATDTVLRKLNPMEIEIFFIATLRQAPLDLLSLNLEEEGSKNTLKLS